MTFLNGPLKEEVYVAQPDGFVDPDHPEKVYQHKKALYGLKQAPRAWHDELLNFMISKGFTNGTIDPNLFTIRYGEDILLAKYALKILKKHGMEKGQSIGTPMATKPKFDADLSGKLIDQTEFRSKIGSLMYLTSSRPDIVQAFLGDKLVSWMSKKQDYTAMSLVEAEYMALSASCAQVITEYHLAYMFTKALREDRFKYLVRRIGMRCLTLAELEVLKPCQGDSLNLPDHSLIPVDSDSLPHAHAQTTKTYYKHQDSRIMKAQESKTKTSANSDIQRSSFKISSLSREIVSKHSR
nr:hypothetical protein [Tanacetum cinerariifolium]